MANAADPELALEAQDTERRPSMLSLKFNYKGHRDCVHGVSFDPQNPEKFASGSADRTVMLWDFNKTARTIALKGHSETVSDVQYSPNGKVLASCSYDYTVRLWVPNVRGKCDIVRGHNTMIKAIAFTPDSRKIITAADDKSIKLWDVQTLDFVASFIGHKHWVTSIQFAPDGRTVMSCADDHTVKIWDINSAQCVHSFYTSKGAPTCLDIHRNGDSVLVAHNTGSVRLYNLKMRKLQQHYVLHNSTECARWHPLKNYFVSGGCDGMIKVVDVLEGRPVFVVKDVAAIECLAFNQHGTYLAVGDNHNRILIWDVEFE